MVNPAKQEVFVSSREKVHDLTCTILEYFFRDRFLTLASIYREHPEEDIA
jgi:DNA mismatch repair ATPase MutL